MRVLTSILTLLLPVALLPAVAAAQGAPKSEVAVTYNWVHTNAPPAECGCFSANGGSASYAYRFLPSFKLVGEVGAVTQGNVNSTGYDLTLWNFLAGGRYTLRNHSRVKPFGQALFGIAHTTGSLSPDQIGLGSSTSFAMSAGGGLDINLSPHLALRAAQADYLLTLLPNRTNDHQNNIRVSAGIVFRF